MNAVTIMRRLEQGGIPHDQAKVMAEVLTDEIESPVATKDFVKLTVEEAKTGPMRRSIMVAVATLMSPPGHKCRRIEPEI